VSGCTPGNTGGFGVTSAACVIVVGGMPGGWGCANADGRTVTVVGATTQTFTGSVCGGTQAGRVVPGADGNVYVNFTAGTYNFTSFYCY
jgi:hypothetical protein